jgi:hypothetical protein
MRTRRSRWPAGHRRLHPWVRQRLGVASRLPKLEHEHQRRQPDRSDGQFGERGSPNRAGVVGHRPTASNVARTDTAAFTKTQNPHDLWARRSRCCSQSRSSRLGRALSAARVAAPGTNAATPPKRRAPGLPAIAFVRGASGATRSHSATGLVSFAGVGRPVCPRMDSSDRERVASSLWRGFDGRRSGRWARRRQTRSDSEPASASGGDGSSDRPRC